MTPPLPEPLMPDAEPSDTARAALKALFEKVRREKLRRDELSLVERADSLFECKALWEGRGKAGKAEFRKSGAPVGRTHERVDLLFAESAQAPFTRRARGSERQPDKEIGD